MSSPRKNRELFIKTMRQQHKMTIKAFYIILLKLKLK